MTSSPERYLERVRALEHERERLAGVGRESRPEQARCVRWALRDLAVELATSPAALRLARAQAGRGDALAAEALQAAAEVDQAVVEEVLTIRSTARKTPHPLSPEPPRPLARVRVALAQSRAAGVPFAKAWTEALHGMARGTKGAGVWHGALAATRQAWADAYNGEGDRGALAAAHEAGGEWRERPATEVAA